MTVLPGDPPLAIEPIGPQHIDALAAILRNDDVYRHLGGHAPAEDRFRLGMQRALQGPPAHRVGERWINLLVRRADTGQVLGRLEATVRPPIAEVAFLFDPQQWGRGYASRGLAWFHGWLLAETGVRDFWATTLPANTRSQGLLERCGYRPVDPAAAPHLLSYDEGDLVFSLSLPAGRE